MDPKESIKSERSLPSFGMNISNFFWLFSRIGESIAFENISKETIPKRTKNNKP